MYYNKIRNTGNYTLGPGGIHCTCCTVGDDRYHKKHSNRSIRRRLKEKLKTKEI